MNLRPIALIAALALTLTGCSDDGDIPYEDKESAGRIALFDAEGNPVTTGNINDKPFVGFAVSDHKAPAPYDKPGRKATLMAFQPRASVEPLDWGGDFLTGATQYSDADRPTVATTTEDSSLANFIAVFPLEWDGLIQLRIYLGAPEASTKTDQYATADIRVEGDTWSLVGDAPEIPDGPASPEPPGSPR